MKKILLFLCLLAIILQLVRIYFINNLDPPNYEYDSLQTQIEQLNKENNILYVELLQKESYMTISKKAKERGFAPGIPVYLR